MTTDTIKDVLGRIISINKNLTEGSLRNLLVASGWENADIEEGVKVFHDYVGTTNLPPSQEEVKVSDLKIPMPERDPAETVASHVSSTGLTGSASEHPIQDMREIRQKIADTEVVYPTAPTPAAAPVVTTQTSAYTQSNTTVPMLGEVSRPWALIVMDSVLFLIALGLLIYIITN